MSNDSYSKRRTECANAGASGTDEATSYRAVTTLTSARNFLGERPGPVCQITHKAARERQTVQSEAINTVVGNPVVTLVWSIRSCRFSMRAAQSSIVYLFTVISRRSITSGRRKSEVALHDLVTLANCMLQHLTLRDVKLPKPIVERMYRLQRTRGDCNTCTTSA